MASVYVNSYTEFGLRISAATMNRFGFSVKAERANPLDEMALVRTDGEIFTEQQEEWIMAFGQGFAAALDLLDEGAVRMMSYHREKGEPRHVLE